MDKSFFHNSSKTIQSLLLSFGLLVSACVLAHEDDMSISTTGPKGPVTLTSAQEKMLQLKVAKVTQRAMTNSLRLNGKVQLLPDAQADVSVRINGSVTKIDVDLGDTVKKGQQLAIIQSRLVGDPPPSVAILAPMTGLIDARNVNLGQSVDPTTILFHISERTQLLVVAQVYEEDAGKVKVGQHVKIHALSYTDRVFEGTINLVEPNLDTLTRTINIRILLSNPDNLLKPGMFVRANVILSQNDAAITVPDSAIVHADEKTFVFVQQDHRYERVEVHTGAINNKITEITKGLSANNNVVIQGVQQLYTLWLSGGSPQGDEH